MNPGWPNESHASSSNTPIHDIRRSTNRQISRGRRGRDADSLEMTHIQDGSTQNGMSGSLTIESTNDDFPSSSRRRLSTTHTRQQSQHRVPTEEITRDFIAPTPRRGRPRRSRHVKCARSFVDSSNFSIHRLPEVPRCQHCGAKLFKFETRDMCCMGGKITLPIPTTPPELYRLYSSQDAESKHFRQHIRVYNHMFSFTSIGVNIDQRLANATSGTYTFRALGSIYHRIGSLLPMENQRPRFLQMYIYDTENELDYRMMENEEMNRNLVQQIKFILDHHNVFVQDFRRLAMRQDLSTCRILLKEHRPERRNFDMPTASQVAAIIVSGQDHHDIAQREIIVQTRDGNLQYVPDTASYYDPLQYPLLLPYGDHGWGINTLGECGNKITCRAYNSYQLQIRENDQSVFLRAGRLLQQYVVDNYVKIDTHKLRYFRHNQDTIRAERYQGVQDSFNAGENIAGNVGRKIILPPSHIGSPRDMYHRYQDAMALVQKYGKPDLFITMTCNPTWDEINNELLLGQVPQDRPDLTTRIFHAKSEELKDDVYDHGVLGVVVAHTHVIEFQKRGLPHMHMLVIFNEEDHLNNPDEYDNIVRAEIPDPNIEPELYNLVANHMIHGPCGPHNPNAPCMKNGVCKKGFPHEFIEITRQGEDSYPIYRRPNNGRVVVKKGVQLDNRWVVPYNPWLLKKYNCHINVEICSSVKSVKYLYKYIHKGSDQVSFELRHQHPNRNDEIAQYEDGRWVCPQEAFWRIYKFQMNQIYPSVIALQIHLPDMQQVIFDERQSITEVLADESTPRTMLTEFFNKNETDEEARQLLYREFPEKYRWDERAKTWYKRRTNQRVIGRMYIVQPTEGERYYLRILLNHVKGPKSFEDLKTNDNDTSETFKEGARKRGLLEDDDSTRQCLLEASNTHMPSALRRLFATLLIYCQPVGVRQLWDEFFTNLSEDYQHRSSLTHERMVNQVLRDLDDILSQYGQNVSNFDLPTITDEQTVEHSNTLIEEELATPIPPEDIQSIEYLNDGQRKAFDRIIDAVQKNKGGMFFIDGPGGTGKSFLYRAILAFLRKEGHIAIATASSGIVATLLPGGRTAHSRFKIPISITSSSVCNISKQSHLAQLLRNASLLLWDEATMTHKFAYEALDRTLRDLTGMDVEFGGKVFLFGGDFRQILPVVPRGTRSETINACIVKSTFWEKVEIIHLTENMRARNDPAFSDFLQKIGDGNVPTVEHDMVKIPDEMVVPWRGEESLTELIDNIFPSLNDNVNKDNYIVDRALMTPTNNGVDQINSKVIESFLGDKVIYYSFDHVEDDPRNLYQQEYLNSISPGGLPPHMLVLKKGAPIMLLRNIDPKNGLCNGTRLLCRLFHSNVIEAEIATGQRKGTLVFIPRIPLKPSENVNLPFNLIRKQFPIRLSFAMTINKAQGQTIPHAGIYLPEHVFTHGQLYVGLSRGISMRTTKLLVKNGNLSMLGTYTRNIVYHEVLLQDNYME